MQTRLAVRDDAALSIIPRGIRYSSPRHGRVRRDRKSGQLHTLQWKAWLFPIRKSAKTLPDQPQESGIVCAFPLLVSPRRIGVIMDTVSSRTDNNNKNHMYGPTPAPHRCSDSIPTMIARRYVGLTLSGLQRAGFESERRLANLRVGSKIQVCYGFKSGVPGSYRMFRNLLHPIHVGTSVSEQLVAPGTCRRIDWSLNSI